MLGALPVALVVRDHAVMSACSAGSVAFVVLFTAVITLMAILPGGVPAAADVTAAPMRTWDASGFLVALPVMAYSFTGHPYFLGIYEMLSAPSVRRMNAVTDQVRGGGGAGWVPQGARRSASGARQKRSWRFDWCGCPALPVLRPPRPPSGPLSAPRAHRRRWA